MVDELAPSERPWVVVPTYNESDNIADLIEALRKAVPQASVLVVDDSSPDGTGEIVRALAADDDQVSLLTRAQKTGLGAAYRDGFREALGHGATAVVEIDADFSHDPTVVPDLLAALDSGAALAIGSRYVRGGSSPGLPPSRLAISRLGNIYASIMLGVPAKDTTAGFRAYRSETLKRIDLDGVRADGYGFQVEMAYEVTRSGGRIREVPIIFRVRRAGSSKMSSRIVIEAMILCTVWGASRRISWLRDERRDERFIDALGVIYRRLERLVGGLRHSSGTS
ncbi:MAG: polyprenol monophosphomannose synthase [Ferrimicrobium sp.]